MVKIPHKVLCGRAFLSKGGTALLIDVDYPEEKRYMVYIEDVFQLIGRDKGTIRVYETERVSLKTGLSVHREDKLHTANRGADTKLPICMVA